MIDEDIRDIHFLYLESTMKVNLVQFWSLNNRCQNVRCQLLLSTFCSESINIQQNPENLAIDRDHLHKYWCSLFFVSRQLFTHWKKKITSHCLRQSQGKLLNEEGCVLVVLALHFVSDRRRPTVIVREVLWWHPAPTKTSPNTIWKVLMDQERIWLCWETERKS